MYEQGSFEPVARIVQLASHIEQKRLADIAYETRRFVRIGESEETINQRIQDKSQPLINIYHYHCNHLGTPQELSDDKGDIVWLSYDRAWGGSFETIYKQQFIDNYALQESELQPIKFQGQFFDSETGLHYNRFRYYDSDVGMFISRDPIGLMGGSNVFQYAPNPIGWIDPWGLSCTQPRDSKGKFLSPKEGDLQPGKDFEKLIADKLSKNKKVELLGTQISVRTGTGRKDIRYMDALIRRKRDGKLFHIEVKSNGASRNADQRMKDGIIDAGKGTFIDGKNTPNGFAGRSTQGITTIVSKPKG